MSVTTNKEQPSSNEWTSYERFGCIEARPYQQGDEADACISFSLADLNRTSREGGMIARNPDHPGDFWYIAPDYFAKHYRTAVEPKTVPTRVRLLKDIFDDGQDHHPAGVLAKKGEVVEVRSLVRVGVAHVGYIGGAQFLIDAGEFETVTTEPPTKELNERDTSRCIFCGCKECECPGPFSETKEYREIVLRAPVPPSASLEAALNPRLWTKEQSDAWHQHISIYMPDVQAGFDALRATVTKSVRHAVTCKLFPDPFDERDPVGPCTCK
jgi:hypothetical protein